MMRGRSPIPAAGDVARHVSEATRAPLGSCALLWLVSALLLWDLLALVVRAVAS